MIPFKRTFDCEKQQLHELNSRLAQYLSRTKLLEEENAHLQTEINRLRQAGGADREYQQYRTEMKDLRRTLDQVSFEKSQLEMEKEKLWNELQMVRRLCSEQSEVCRDINGDLKGRDVELQQAHRINSQLQQRLAQLEAEYVRLEDAHRHEKEHLRHQVESTMAPMVTQTYSSPHVVSGDEVQHYARGLSEGWMHTLDMYQQKVNEMEVAIREDQAMLGDLQREKMLYATEMEKMRKEAERQGRIQMHLEEELARMQETFRAQFCEYQMIIKQLEDERDLMADTMSEKMREHQVLLQVKTDLGMEVAAYRALLEGERIGLQDAQRRANHPQKERVIDIKMPDKPYTPRTSILTSRQHTNVRYTPPASNFRRPPVHLSGSRSPSRVVPISVTERARHQSPASRRDMISFNKARAAMSNPATTTTTTTIREKQTEGRQDENQRSQNVQKTRVEEISVKSKHVSQEAAPSQSVPSEADSVKLPSNSFSTKTESRTDMSGEKETSSHHDDFKEQGKSESVTGPTEKKVLDDVSVEEIIEKVIKPAGLEAKFCSSGESQVTYHVEKIQQEDGSAKTQIVLESKVEEEVDVCKESSLDELLKQGAKKVSLEDIQDTATGSMIKNLLKGLQGADLQNKSVSVEITEAPVESQSNDELEIEQKFQSTFDESSSYFHIEELEDVPGTRDEDTRSYTPDTDRSRSGFEQIQEVSRESESSHLSQDLHEYFVSTPDENLSEPEEGGGITSYGHYGIVDDLSDERYYQDDVLPQRRVTVEETHHKLLSSDLFGKESFPECIMEEEVRVSPIVQESVLEYLREDSLEPKEQLKGALEKLQSSVSGPLKEELAFLTKISNESPQNVAVDIKKVQQSSDNGTTTIVAELNVSQTLEDSGLLDAEEGLSEEQIMAALRSSNLGFEEAFQGGAGGGYSIRVSKEPDSYERFRDEGECVYEITERSQKSHSDAQGSPSEEQPLHEWLTPATTQQEKRIATILLESPSDV